MNDRNRNAKLRSKVRSVIVSPLVKVCPQCGFAQNPDAQEACVNCKVDLTLVPVARPGRKFIPRNVAIFSAGIGLMVVGFSLMFLVRSLVFFFIGFIVFLIVSYLGGIGRGGHQQLWKLEYPPYDSN